MKGGQQQLCNFSTSSLFLYLARERAGGPIDNPGGSRVEGTTGGAVPPLRRMRVEPCNQVMLHDLSL